MRLDSMKPLTLPDHASEVTPNLEDEQTIVVSRQPIYEQMAESITVLPMARDHSSLTSSPTSYSETTSSPPTTPALQPEIPIIDHDDLSIPASWLTEADDATEDQSEPDRNDAPHVAPPSTPDTETVEYLSANTCKWLAAEFYSMAKNRAAEQEEAFLFKADTKSAITTIQEDLRALTDKCVEALTRVLRENRVIKTLLDTILNEVRKAAHAPSPTSTDSTTPPSPTSTQAADIPPFGKCPPDNTPA